MEESRATCPMRDQHRGREWDADADIGSSDRKIGIDVMRHG